MTEKENAPQQEQNENVFRLRLESEQPTIYKIVGLALGAAATAALIADTVDTVSGIAQGESYDL